MMQIDRDSGKAEVTGTANACLTRVWYLQGRCQLEMTVSHGFQASIQQCSLSLQSRFLADAGA